MAQTHYAGIPQAMEPSYTDRKDTSRVHMSTVPDASNVASELPPDFQQLEVQHGFMYKYRCFISRFWIWEAFCSILAILTLAAIVGVLGYYNDRSTAAWSLEWNINSVIALLVTIMKGAMLVPVASCIGQLKWLWFKRQRKLKDMDSFDNASRGVLGSVQLLFELRFWHLASIGAIITIAALTIDTLTQGVITTRPDWTYKGVNATIPRTNSFAEYQKLTTGDIPGDQWAPSGVMTGLNQAYSWPTSANGNDSWMNMKVNCPEHIHSCVFPMYQSLGVDAQCIDRTSDILPGDNATWLLDDTVILDSSIEVLAARPFPMYPPPLDLPYTLFGPLISRTIITFNSTTESPLPIPPDTFECILYWVVITYTNNYTSNINDERFANTSYAVQSNITTDAQTSYNQSSPIWIEIDECWVNNTHIEDPRSEPGCTYWVGPRAQLGLQNILAHPTYGMNDSSVHIPGTDIWYPTAPFITNIFELVGLNNTQLLSYTALTFSRIATGITYAIRQLPKGAPPNVWVSTSVGDTYIREEYFSVRWRWLAVPIFLVVASVCFLAVTILTHETRMAWRTSVLPYVYHGLVAGDRASLGEPMKFADIQASADVVQVRLADMVEGLRLVRGA